MFKHENESRSLNFYDALLIKLDNEVFIFKTNVHLCHNYVQLLRFENSLLWKRACNCVVFYSLNKSSTPFLFVCRETRKRTARTTEKNKTNNLLDIIVRCTGLRMMIKYTTKFTQR